jgi:N-acetylmuramoyl-L-alanine amidase-like protein
MLLAFSKGLRVSRPKRILVFCLLPLLSFVISGCLSEEQSPPKIIGNVVHTIIDPIIVPKTKPAVLKKTDITGIPTDWIPPSYLENKSRWKGIVIHHSAGDYGCAAHEHKYHLSRGWDGLGYQFVINNGIIKNGYGKPNGLVEVGYRWRQQKVGSHCRANGDNSNYWNKYTIGICLIGNFERTYPTQAQMRSLAKLVKFLQQRYNIPTSQIRGHENVKPTKCPGRKFSMTKFKQML